jgi:putative tryptophan/tyrosine transport system substrate-binding protein
MSDMKRREFIALLGGAAAAWPLAARAQQPAMPVIGYIDIGDQSHYLAAFNRGLAETGYVVGQNAAIEFRSAAGQYDRFPQLAAELVRRNVTVIATAFTPAALAAKAATSTIPIVFSTAADPVKIGLVASLARPGGNATGISFFSAELAAKRLGLLRELVPTSARIAVLVNPADATRAESTVRDVEAAARIIGLEVRVLEASTGGEIDVAFASIARDHTDALFVAPDGFFNTRRVHLATLAARHAIPATYGARDYAEAGGLMSYGASATDANRQAGVYAGRILKGEKPADLPVLQPTKFEFVINLQTAKAIGLTVPDKLLVAADEVIE